MFTVLETWPTLIYGVIGGCKKLKFASENSKHKFMELISGFSDTWILIYS